MLNGEETTDSEYPGYSIGATRSAVARHFRGGDFFVSRVNRLILGSI
jgi:hypothetical protein